MLLFLFNPPSGKFIFSDSEITELNIPTGVPLVYELDADLKPIKHYYLGNEEAIAQAVASVASQASAKK